MDTIDWRAQLQPDFRQRKVNEIMSKVHNPLGDEDELLEAQKIVQSFEHKTYAGATSQEDYLQKIYSVMLSFEGDWRAQLQPDSRQRIVNKMYSFLCCFTLVIYCILGNKNHMPYLNGHIKKTSSCFWPRGIS